MNETGLDCAPFVLPVRAMYNRLYPGSTSTVREVAIKSGCKALYSIVLDIPHVPLPDAIPYAARANLPRDLPHQGCQNNGRPDMTDLYNVHLQARIDTHPHHQKLRLMEEQHYEPPCNGRLPQNCPSYGARTYRQRNGTGSKLPQAVAACLRNDLVINRTQHSNFSQSSRASRSGHSLRSPPRTICTMLAHPSRHTYQEKNNASRASGHT